MTQFGMLGRCPSCNQEYPNFNWCRTCNAKHFQQNFKNWTSGNGNIDKFIQDAQKSANKCSDVLEWIPYEKFHDIEMIARGGFGTVFKAIWTDGLIRKWDDTEQDWERHDSDEFVVALKSLNNSKNVSLDFLNEITCHRVLDSAFIIKLYGITQDPETEDYMMVLEYAENGSLRDYLDRKILNWTDKIHCLYLFALGLDQIHEIKLNHRDLHIGNILIHNEVNNPCITDMGLCRPANHDATGIYGNIPYVAPEIFRRVGYTEAADIYSFGIIMYEVISGVRPHSNIKKHDVQLIIKICQGLRPKFNIEVPQLILQLFEKCVDANPLSRPTAKKLTNDLKKLWEESDNKLRKLTEIKKQIRKAEKINNNLSTSSIPLSSETSKAITSDHDLHELRNSDNITNMECSKSYRYNISDITLSSYTSRLLDFDNLPKPKNSDSISNMECSGQLDQSEE